MKRKFLSSMLAAALLYVGSFSAGAMGVEEVSVPNKQLPALQQSPAGEYATVLEMQVKSGMESVMTVKTDMYDRLVMRFSNTLLMDTQTGTPVSETDIAAGDKVFVYYADYVMETEPPQTDAAAVLVNLEDGHAPARLLTAEAIQHPAEEDGSVTILTDNGELLLTVQKDTDIRPLGTKNIASADDIHMGTRFFAWYDQVALSEPGQAVATRIVIPAQQGSRFAIVVEGDMVLPLDGRVEQGILMVPVRTAAEALGYTVVWNGENESISLKKGERETLLVLGKDQYAADFRMGVAMALGAAPYEVAGVSWAPAEFFSLLGESVTLRAGELHLGIVRNNQLPAPN